MKAAENQPPSKRLVELSHKDNLTPAEKIEMEELKNQLFFDSAGEKLDDIEEMAEDDLTDYLNSDNKTKEENEKNL